jgi:hypothetical protein
MLPIFITEFKAYYYIHISAGTWHAAANLANIYGPQPFASLFLGPQE